MQPAVTLKRKRGRPRLTNAEKAAQQTEKESEGHHRRDVEN